MNERVKSHPLMCTLLLCFEDEEDDVEEPEEVEDEDAEVSAKFEWSAFSQESSAVSLSLGWIWRWIYRNLLLKKKTQSSDEVKKEREDARVFFVSDGDSGDLGDGCARIRSVVGSQDAGQHCGGQDACSWGIAVAGAATFREGRAVVGEVAESWERRGRGAEDSARGRGWSGCRHSSGP